MARNEATFRRVNEAIESGASGRDGPVGFICECGALGCNQIVELTTAEYEAVRADPLRFFVMHGHEITEVEDVVESHDRYAVVVKKGEGAPVAEQTDPRSSPDDP